MRQMGKSKIAYETNKQTKSGLRNCTYRGIQKQPDRSKDTEKQQRQGSTKQHSTTGGEVILVQKKSGT